MAGDGLRYGKRILSTWDIGRRTPMRFNKENWSSKTFSACYAGAIAFFVVMIAFLLLHFQRIKTINLRVVYVPIVFLAVLLFYLIR